MRAADAPRAGPSVLLVSMPWTALEEPSLGLSMLRAVLDGEGIPARVWHLNLSLLRHLRVTTYLALAGRFALNDFVFSGVLSGPPSHRQLRWLRHKTEELLDTGLVDAGEWGGVDGVVEQLVHLRGEVIPAWLAEAADQIAASDATLVGFTCMFDQTVASLALAREVRRRAPGKTIALGGYAVREPTGGAVMRAFPWVDAVCTGEGDDVIVPLARASAGELPLASVPGLLVRGDGGAVVRTATPPAFEMERSVTPNFDDYFADVAALDREHRVQVEVETLPLETSRGCWWGQVKHCVFCGIHDDDLRYRTRPAEDVLASLETLRARHGIAGFRFSDYILPHAYFQTLLPMLAQRGAPFRLACEMKANSSHGHFGQLAAAGFREVQPGIESFSSRVLRSMDKGVTAALNVQTLVLGRRHGIHIHYNLLYGLPDDDAADYEAMLASLPRLLHLNPPLTNVPVQITRYAPLHVDPARFGIPAARYEPSYEVIFSEEFLEQTGFDLNDFCYYFDRPFQNSPRLSALYRRIVAVVDGWRRVYAERTPVLWYDLDEDGIVFFDSRHDAAGRVVRLGADEAVVYARCAAGPVVVDRLQAELGGALEAGRARAALDLLDAHGLVFVEGGAAVGLAVPRPSHAQDAWVRDELRAAA